MGFKKHSLGIMQGRLTEPKGRGIQFFPFENWENEFYIASEMGLDEIEFIFDYDHYEENPLYTAGGINSIKNLVRQTGVAVNSVCFDYFMHRAFYKDSLFLKSENTHIAKKIISASEDIGAKIFEIPAVDDSSVKNDDERALFIDFIRELTANTQIIINIESDFEPDRFRSLLSDIGLPCVRANYDSGNSSGLGYDHYKEITTLGDYVSNVHIKDRTRTGVTMPLGHGDADFHKLFSALRETDYTGSFILQAARGDDGSESETVAKQASFVRKYIREYLAS